MHQITKVQMRNDLFFHTVDYRFVSDVSIVLDASGGQGTVYHPHFHSHNKNEIQRFQLMKVHCMFTKIHGFGVMIFRGINKLEATGGANFGLECLYLSLLYYLTEKRKHCPNHQIRNLYFQGDNAKLNKCMTTFAGLGALVSYGICVKAKMSFGLANHNHMDIDATIGKNS